MRTRTTSQAPRTGGRAAFSLVELLVVIAVITLLIGIMVPTVAKVKDVAKAGATKALLHSISSGLDMFKTESKLGRQYPPSFWDAGKDDQGAPRPGWPECSYYGAQTLVWGLAGADLRGTAGFGVDPSKSPPITLQTLYTDPNTPRYGPFIDISKAKIKKPNDPDLGIDLPDGNPDAPVITDNFDMPVLYYRSNGNGGLNAYTVNDNEGFLANQPLARGNSPKAGRPAFEYYIEDARVWGTPTPYNPDSYLLISAGPDKRYGTRDDVANFPFNPLPQ